MEGIEFDGPKGKISVRPEDHVAIQDMYIVKILNVDDPEFRFFELVDTTRPEPPCLLPEALQGPLRRPARRQLERTVAR